MESVPDQLNKVDKLHTSYMTIASAYISLVSDGPRLSFSTVRSSGAVQLIDSLVREKGSNMIDVRP